jgi:hypothetical protein
VLTLDGHQIKEVTAFIARSTDLRDARDFARWPEYPPDAAKVVALFERFGLPSRLD